MIDRVQGLVLTGLDALLKLRANRPARGSEEIPAADRASLSQAARAVLANPSSRIAELRAAVEADSYGVSSAAVADRLVSGALAQ